MAKLVAASDMVYIDASAGQTSGATQIDYDLRTDRGNVLWQRYAGRTSWVLINVVQRVLNELPNPTAEDALAAENSGTFASDPVRPGDILEYCLTGNEDINPNVPSLEREIILRIAVFGLVNNSNPSMVGDEFHEIGGTYFYQQLDTIPHGPTVARLQIGRVPPVDDVNGMPVFAEPIDTVLTESSTLHDLQTVKVLPGNRYFAVIRLSDDKGRWSVLRHDDIVAKRRTVWMNFPVIHLFNDGDNSDSGEAEFGVSVYRGDPQGKMSHVDGRQLADDDSPMTITTGMADFATNFAPIVIGPEKVPSDKDIIRVVAHGVEYDGALEPNEHASSVFRGGRLYIPVGRKKEEVPISGTWIITDPLGPTDTFFFAIFMSYSIKYAV